MPDYSLSEVKDRDDSYLVEGGGFTQDKLSSALSQFMTLGGGIGGGKGSNEVSTTYIYDKGAHHIKLLDRVSPEVVLIFMSHMVGFHIQTKSGEAVQTTERTIKKNLLRTADLF
jgi:hypothetical protein